MRLIDADELWMEIIHTFDYCDDILEVIEHQKTIERPEIIRCVDCKWWNKQGKASLQGRCSLFDLYPTGKWFCGNGRKE